MKNDKYKINESNFINGIYEHLLKDILSGKLEEKNINNYCKCFMHKIKNDEDRSFPRQSKTPFTKWYVKEYSAGSSLVKIINALLTSTVSSLNKNLKLKANYIKIK